MKRSLALTLAAVAATALGPVAAAPAAGGPSRTLAASYAARTYVQDAGLGKRHFELVGAKATARGSDGSTITAYGVVLADSGDGTGQAVLLFRGTRFLGWAAGEDTLHLRVTGSGHAISVRYGSYRGNDPFCCPSSTKTVHYRYRGGKIVADAKPPLIYGRHGSKLHLENAPLR